MAACREAQDANTFRINVPLLAMSAHGANGPLCVRQRNGMAVGTDAILADNAGHAKGIEPLRHHPDKLIAASEYRQQGLADFDWRQA